MASFYYDQSPYSSMQLILSFYLLSYVTLYQKQDVKRKTSFPGELKELQRSTLPLRCYHFYFSFTCASVYVGKDLLTRLKKMRG